MKYTKEERKQRKALGKEVATDLWHGRSVILDAQQLGRWKGIVLAYVVCGVAVAAVSGLLPPEPLGVFMTLTSGMFVGGAVMLGLAAFAIEFDVRWNDRPVTPEEIT